MSSWSSKHFASVRVICSFQEDIYTLAKCLLDQDDIELLETKDFPFWANLRLILSIDFNLVFIVSIGLRSYWSEYCSFNTLNFVSISIIAQRYFDISSSNGRLLSWITSITFEFKIALLSTRSIISPENSICSVLSSLISIETPFLRTKCAVTLFITLLKESCQQLPTAFYSFF